MKLMVVWLLKAVAAGILTFIILCLFCLFYMNSPFTLPSPNGQTDRIYAPNRYYSMFTEGYGYGKTDLNGYMNHPVLAEEEEHDIIIMGSSHMAANQIPHDKNVAYMMHTAMSDFSIYNLGHDGHHFLVCAQNFRNAVEYERPQYVIMETYNVDFSDKDIEAVLSNTRPKVTNSNDTGIMYYVRQLPYLRLLFLQWRKVSDSLNIQNAGGGGVSLTPSMSDELLATLLQNLNQTAEKNEASLIIFFHQRFVIQSDGDVETVVNANDIKNFADLCTEAGITFVDMTNVFLDMYKTEHILPYGFFNTAPGGGHLNELGHKMIADELAKIIREMEAKK